MNEIQHKQIAKIRIEQRLAQADVLRRAIKAEKKELKKHIKGLVNRDKEVEEYRATIESYKDKMEAILNQPDHEQLTLNLAGEDFGQL